MKKLIISLSIMIITVGIFASLPARAQDTDVMTDEHIARIKSNCASALATLGQIRTNDALVYVNRNQSYFSISDKLIARLNSRLALNRFDTTPLAKIATEYNGALTDFRTAYNDYSRVMTDLVKIDCSRQPVGFYDKVGEAREMRQDVYDAIKKLHTIIDQYRQAVDTFKQQHLTKLKANTNE